jgi:putative ABC transport system ATP-binding protein
MITLQGVAKRYGSGTSEVRALDGVDLEVGEGEFVAIVGPSGSGKSTLLQLIGALDQPTDGTVSVDGSDTSALAASDLTSLRQRTIGFVFQQFNLIPTLSAQRNVETPMVPSGIPGTRRSERARDLLVRLGLGERADHLPAQLSGGEQQRVAIARALANDPRLILADEPTGNLDTATGRDVMRLMRGLNTQGHTVVLITHDDEIAQAARRIVRLRDGRIVADERRGGDPEDPDGADADEVLRAAPADAAEDHR